MEDDNINNMFFKIALNKLMIRLDSSDDLNNRKQRKHMIKNILKCKSLVDWFYQSSTCVAVAATSYDPNSTVSSVMGLNS